MRTAEWVDSSSWVNSDREACCRRGASVLALLPGNGHFPWLEDPGSVRRSLDRLLASTV
jgi:pimeloyl-ACP methyl ester carboxylesterase